MKNNYSKIGVVLSFIFICLFSTQALVAHGIKDKIDDASDFLKKEVDKISGGVESVQEYLDHYSWKGIIQDKANSGVATLGHLKLNDHSKAYVAYPGQQIDAVVRCTLDSEKCSSLTFYRVVIGIKGVGPQTTVCNYFGAAAKESDEKLTLVAPQAPGIYEIRFRVAECFTETEAFKEWVDPNGKEPDSSTTIGILVVK